MPAVKHFEELKVWQSAFAIYKAVIPIVNGIKSNKDYRLAEQIKSSSGSIMDNIAEEFERNSRLEFINSLSISKGECGELQSQLHRILLDNYISREQFDKLYNDSILLSKQIANFIKYLNNSSIKGLKFKDRV